jgi:hypothetical protein
LIHVRRTKANFKTWHGRIRPASEAHYRLGGVMPVASLDLTSRFAISKREIFMSDPAIIPAPEIQQRIHSIRGKRVILDADLARYYAVGTRDLNKAVARNLDRFPEDFAFMLTLEETRALMFQAGTSKSGRGGVRKPARVFTEQGVAMLAGVLRSPRAVAMSITIVRAFVQIRELLAQHRQLAGKLTELERKLQGHDHAIANLFEAIRQLLAPDGPRHRRKIGFHQGNR